VAIRISRDLYEVMRGRGCCLPNDLPGESFIQNGRARRIESPGIQDAKHFVIVRRHHRLRCVKCAGQCGGIPVRENPFGLVHVHELELRLREPSVDDKNCTLSISTTFMLTGNDGSVPCTCRNPIASGRS